MSVERFGKYIFVVVFGFLLAACGTTTHELSVSNADHFIERFWGRFPDNPLMVNDKPFNGTLIARHPGDIKATEVEMKNGRPNGKISRWFANGQQRETSQGHWDEAERAVVRTGLSREWREDGSQISESRRDASGRLHGDQVELCPNGQREGFASYRDGKRHGLFERWHCDTGQRISAIGYQDDVLDGVIESWFSDGTPALRTEVRSDRFQGLIERWFESGQLAERATLAAEQPDIDTLRQAPIQALQSDGQLADTLRFSGSRTRWSSSGERVFEAHYTNQGEPAGIWTEISPRWGAKRKHYQREAWVEDQYQPPIARALRNPREAEAVFYYLDNQLVRPDALVEVTGDGSPRGAIHYAAQSSGWPRSHWAPMVHGIPFELLPRLLEAGADINARDSKERTPLMRCAANIGSPGADCTAAQISYLLENKADLHAVDLYGANALRYLGADAPNYPRNTPNPAVEHAKAFTLLLEAGAALDAPDANGDTLLIEALQRRNTDLALLLIDAGADVKKANKKGNAPIHFVFLERDDWVKFDSGAFSQRMLPLLISKGADINKRLKWDNGEEITLHQLSLRVGAIEVAKFLEQNGANEK